MLFYADFHHHIFKHDINGHQASIITIIQISGTAA
jgi:hypothetical protein